MGDSFFGAAFDIAKTGFEAVSGVIDKGVSAAANTYKKDADMLRTKLATWMRDTDDYLLPAFRVRNEPDRLEAFMVAADSEALKRAETIEWKRWNNRAGPVEGDRVLYKKTAK